MNAPSKNVQERPLFEMKWYDYRAIPHDMATLVCIAHFCEHIKLFHKTMLGEEDAEQINILKSCGKLSAIFDWKWWRSFEVIRQYCDKHCMPYGFFWETAIQMAVDKGFPRPSIITTYLNVSIQKAVLAEYMQDGADIRLIRFSKLEIFKADNYSKLRRQDDYYWHIIRSVRGLYSGKKREEVIGLIVKRGQIAEEFLRANNIPYTFSRD